MKKYVNIDAYFFETDMLDEKSVNDLMNQYMKLLSYKIDLQLSIEYHITDKGYRYTIKRKRHCKLQGNFVLDQDACLVTGLKMENFEVHPLKQNGKVAVQGILLWYDGCYIPEDGLATLYEAMISTPKDAEQPKNVKITADDTHIDVNVEY